MIDKKNGNSGFSLIEVLTSSVILMFVIIAFYSLIISNQATQVTEENRTDMNQSARAIDQILCENIRNAGSVLTLLHTPTFLGASAPFTGIYPLNNDTYPDGIILASGDIDAVTKVSGGSFTPGDTLINVENVNNPDNTDAAWSKNDVGIVFKSTGYYVFKVTADVNMGDTTLTVRALPIYYSGLLNVPGKYNDLTDEILGSYGNVGSYSSNSPVIRLNYFNIFLVKSENDGTRTLTLTSDTQGMANVLTDGAETSERAVPIVPNISDIQFEFITKDIPPELWASSSTDLTSYADPCASPGDVNCTNFIQNFIGRNFSSVRIYLLLRTEDKHRKKNTSSGAVGQAFSKPRMGDAPATTLAAGRFHYTYLTYELYIRNFNVIY